MHFTKEVISPYSPRLTFDEDSFSLTAKRLRDKPSRHSTNKQFSFYFNDDFLLGFNVSHFHQQTLQRPPLLLPRLWIKILVPY